MVAALFSYLFAINSCVNPFVYAQTIPAFKEIVRSYFCPQFAKAPNETKPEETMKMIGIPMESKTSSSFNHMRNESNIINMNALDYI